MRRLRVYLLETGRFARLSVGTLYAILRGAHLVIRQCRSWFGRYGQSKLQSEEEFERRKADVIAAYTQVPENEVTVCVDVKRAYHRDEAGAAWHHEKVPWHKQARYHKPGTRTDIIGALQLREPDLHLCCTPCADGAAMGAFLVETVRRCLALGYKLVHFVMDNSTVNTAGMKDVMVAGLEHLVRVHWTPTHASWLNLAEAMWSAFHRAVIQGSCFRLHEEVVVAVEQYEAYWQAHPHRYRWPKPKVERHRAPPLPLWKRMALIPVNS